MESGVRVAAVACLALLLPACSNDVATLGPSQNGSHDPSDAGNETADAHRRPNPNPNTPDGAGGAGGDASPVVTDSGTKIPPASGPPDAQAQDPVDESGWRALLDWDNQPSFGDSVTHLFSSHEREGGGPFKGVDADNKDYNSFLAVCGDRPALKNQQVDDSVPCEEGQAGYLVAADDGPGYISRFFLALGAYDPSPFVRGLPKTERIAIYADDMTTPAYEGLLVDWAKSVSAPFGAPLTGWTSGATISYVPISYGHKLRVFLDGLSTDDATYYPQITTHTSDSTRPFDVAASSGPEARARLVALNARAAGDDHADGWFDDDVTLVGKTPWRWERSTAGTVQRFTLVVDAKTAKTVLDDVTVRAFWNGETAPSIESTLSALLGTRQVATDFTTWPMSASTTGDSTSYVVALPMPFDDAARIELVGNSGTTRALHVRIAGTDTLPRAPFGRLHTRFTVEDDPGPGDRFVVADLEGPGRYVGTLMYMKGRSDADAAQPVPLNFLEGDETFEIDGLSSVGTGTEDYFGGGWYFANGPFSSPLAALVYGATDNNQNVGLATAVRWHTLSDAIDFKTRFRLSFEYGANKPGTAIEYAATAFYYR